MGTCSWKNGHVYFEKRTLFLDIWALFQKWLPRPNHSAHIKGIEILCKTAVSMSRDVSSESKSIGANSKYSSPAGKSTRSFMICEFHIFSHHRSEGFPRTGYLVPAHGTPWVLPNGQSSLDVAAAVAVSWFHRGAIAPRTPHPAYLARGRAIRLLGPIPECLVLQYTLLI